MPTTDQDTPTGRTARAATRTEAERARRRRLLVAGGTLGAVLLAIGLWLTQPWLLFVDTVADESLPISIQESTDAAGNDALDAGDDGASSASDASAADGDVADDIATDQGATQEDDDAIEEDLSEDGAGGDDAVAAGEVVEPAEPAVLLRGEFISRDHATSGLAAVVELPDGDRVLTIEDLATDNGPDLFVYLDDSPADGPEDDFDDGVSLGRLRANQGDLVYEIPADLDLSTITSIGIWCDRFSSLFGAADLRPVA